MTAATYVTAQLLRVLPRARIGQAIGKLAVRPWPPLVERAVVTAYSRVYRVALDEAAADRWGSFDAFFTRELRRGTRPIDVDPRAIVSPADGRLESATRIATNSTFVVKGRSYSVEELVGGAAEAKRLSGGAGFVVYLSPRDYHRVHAPVGGAIRRIRSLPGDYFPVNAVGLRHVPNLFCRNRRVAVEIDAEGGLGRVTVVLVVAILVGRITTVGVDAADVPFGDHTFDPPIAVSRGDEVGVFHLGSTAVVLLEAAAAGAWALEEGPVRVGQTVIRAPGGVGV
jgi:phosphatidylserine decarboxylase